MKNFKTSLFLIVALLMPLTSCQGNPVVPEQNLNYEDSCY